MTTLEILKAARELISAPERWTRNAYARTACGDSIGARAGLACKWCIMGAIGKVEADQGNQLEAIKHLRHCHGSGLAEFNDATSTRHSDVIALFDRAIARLSSPDSERGRDG